jgi:hypothetical protein
MPIYSVPPEIQSLVSGQNLHPTLGPGLDAFAQQLQQRQESNRSLVDSIGRQDPGFMGYLVQNHPDIIEEITGPPKMFRHKGDPPLSAKLQQAMTAYKSQPGPAELSAGTGLTGAEAVSVNEKVQQAVANDPRLRTAPPETRAQAAALLHHALVATNSDDSARSIANYESLLGQKPTEEMSKYQNALDVLGSGMFGQMSPDEKATAAARYAGVAGAKSVMDEDNQLLDHTIKEKQSQQADLDAEFKRLEIAQKKQEAETGQKVPAADTTFLANIGFTLKSAERAAKTIEGLGPVETTMGSLLKAPAYSTRAAALNAQLSTLAVTFERLGLQLPGRISPVLIEMLRGALVDYSKTPTQLHGIVQSALTTLSDLYESRLEQLETAGIAKGPFYEAQRTYLGHYQDLALSMAEDKKWFSKPAPAGLVGKVKGLFGGGAGPGPGSAAGETPGTSLFPPTAPGADAEE